MAKFWKFECPDAASADVFVRGCAVPAEVRRRRNDDSYAKALASLRPGHGVVAGTLSEDSGRAQVYAIGRIIGSRGGGADAVRVVWKLTPNLRLDPQGIGLDYWTQAACEIKPEPAKRYDLAERVASVGILSSLERVEYASKLKGIGYTGTRLEDVPETCDLLTALERAGFAVAPRGKKSGKPGDGLPRGTIQVEKAGAYLAYVPSGNTQAFPVEHLIGLANLQPGTRRTVQAMPLEPIPFDENALAAFARERRVPSEHLKLAPETGKGARYLRVTNFDTALTLILQNERLLEGLPVHAVDEVEDLEYETEAEEEGAENSRSGSGESDSLESRCIRFAAVEVRHEQRAFRIAVFKRWGGRCVVSGCSVPEALEAAHIHGRSWREGHNADEDGLLLRRDLHTLYDRHLLHIDSAGSVQVTAEIRAHYEQFHGAVLPQPASFDL